MDIWHSRRVAVPHDGWRQPLDGSEEVRRRAKLQQFELCRLQSRLCPDLALFSRWKRRLPDDVEVHGRGSDLVGDERGAYGTEPVLLMWMRHASPFRCHAAARESTGSVGPGKRLWSQQFVELSSDSTVTVPWSLPCSDAGQARRPSRRKSRRSGNRLRQPGEQSECVRGPSSNDPA
jgi:hypothetical protein